jgi:glycerate 2-kinase
MPQEPKLSALVSLSAFKEALTNEEACSAVAKALGEAGIVVRQFPIGDGGTGTLSTVQASLGGAITTMEVSGPLAGKVSARVLCLPDSVSPNTVYIESAEACGLSLVPKESRNAMRSSSLGLGEIIQKCLDKWRPSLKKIYVGLGDTLTSDGGLGMLYGLGYRFYDSSGHSLWGSAQSLRDIKYWKAPSPNPFKGVKFTILCDVLNPLCGPKGTARTFASQKGASTQEVCWIEEGLQNLAGLIETNMGRNVRNEPMTGSAGGLGAAFRTFLNADLVHGARFLMDWLHYDDILAQHDFVITGEGCIDAQTLAGKAPMECVERAERLGKRIVLMCGMLGPGHESISSRSHVAAYVSCGALPTASEALFNKTVELFTDPKVFAELRS